MIDYALKSKCVALYGKMKMRQIYTTVFLPEYDRMSYETFRHRLREWKNKQCADEKTLSCGTYPGYFPHDATVQVDKNGDVTQAWIKQGKQDVNWDEIKDFIAAGKRSNVVPSVLDGETMLEIPLFDMHFGVADFGYYKPTLSDLLGIVSCKSYDEINILFGQDVLHNNDMRGRTAKGTQIETVNFTQSWKDAWLFFCTLIDAAIGHAKTVNLRYSKGNHDECSAWCLFKTLEAIYPQCKCDDSLAPRKCIYWRGCFIGFGHCNYTSNNSLIFENFVLDFPKEFANAKVREIHSGHLHRESIDKGIMIRRLPSGVPTDKWSSDNGYTGAHKRFQIFEWAENRLRSIHYV